MLFDCRRVVEQLVLSNDKLSGLSERSRAHGKSINDDCLAGSGTLRQTGVGGGGGGWSMGLFYMCTSIDYMERVTIISCQGQ